jgi:CubicO group peptidase (beta-lactamase class C family)
MTKAITSVAVMMLYEEGHFLLGDPVSKYIREFRKPRTLLPDSLQHDHSDTLQTEPAKREIKIRDLLTHKSGLTYQWNKRLGLVYKEAGITHGLLQDESTIGEKMRRLAGLPLLFHPGDKHHYGLSIDVLGHLVEVTSGMTLDEFFQKRVFGPLKMKDTHFFPPKGKLDRLAAVYRPGKDGGIERAPEGPIKGPGSFVYSIDYPYKGPKHYFSGGGGLCSTVADYARFCQMLLNGGHLDGIRLLSRKTVELMTTDHVKELRKDGGFGLGFLVTRDLAESGEIGSLGAYGWGGFFYTRFVIDPEEELVTIFMSQKYPTGGTRLADRFRALAYQAIID